jgi:hypothetical protein
MKVQVPGADEIAAAAASSPPASTPATRAAAEVIARSPEVRTAATVRLPLLPAPAVAAARMPTTIDCLQCQLLGKRRLTCAKADACASLPQSFAVGPALLAAWAITTIAFLLAVL